MAPIRKILKARAPPSFPSTPQKCLSDEEYTPAIAELADYNSEIRSRTRATSTLVESFRAAIASSEQFPSLVHATAENPSSYEYSKISLRARADAPIIESSLINLENGVRTIIYPGSAFPSTSAQIYVLRGSRPSYQAHQGMIYFSQFCAIPENTPQSIETTLLPREWGHTEEALVIEPLNGTGTRYVNQPLLEKFGLSSWYAQRFSPQVQRISLAVRHIIPRKK